MIVTSNGDVFHSIIMAVIEAARDCSICFASISVDNTMGSEG